MNNMGNKRNYNPNNSLQNQGYAGNKQGYGRNNYAPKNESRMSNPQKKSDNERNQARVNLRQTGDMGLVKEKGPARQKRQGGYASNIYGNISTTVQKKFNNALYKDGDKKERCMADKPSQNRVRKNSNGQNKRFSVIDSKSSLNKDREGISKVQYNRNLSNINDKKSNKKEEIKKYNEETSASAYEDEVIEVLPKSVFVFITVAVVFVAALVFTVANKDKVGKVISEMSPKSNQVITNDYDEGIELDSMDVQGKLDSNQENMENVEDLEELEDEEDLEETESEETGILSTIASATKTKKDNTTNNTSNKTSNKTSTTQEQVAATQKPAATVKPAQTPTNPSEEFEEEVEEEVEETMEDVEMTFIALSLTGKLWRCSSSYGVFGAENSFKKCSDSYYIEASNMVMVPKNDKNGIWLDVRGAKVVDYVGYKAGQKVQVVKIRLEEADSTVYKDIYAIKDTYIDLGGNYKKKGSTSSCRSIFATEDMTMQKVG